MVRPATHRANGGALLILIVLTSTKRVESLFAYVDIKTGANTGPDQLGKLVAQFAEVRRAVWTT